MKNFDYTQIDKYFNGELTKKELIAFNKKLKTDTDFATEVALVKEIENTLTSKMSNQKEENNLRNTLEDLGKEFGVKNKKQQTVFRQNKQSKDSKKTVTKVFNLQRFSKLYGCGKFGFICIGINVSKWQTILRRFCKT